mmetsp:Transcript_102216/g.317959  ORF Transcript_102216/g.317959 Transcript_102216/m.317959 type:complete len:254 (+) Transcript_102216:395-1156(+)
MLGFQDDHAVLVHALPSQQRVLVLSTRERGVRREAQPLSRGVGVPLPLGDLRRRRKSLARCQADCRVLRRDVQDGLHAHEGHPDTVLVGHELDRHGLVVAVHPVDDARGQLPLPPGRRAPGLHQLLLLRLRGHRASVDMGSLWAVVVHLLLDQLIRILVVQVLVPHLFPRPLLLLAQVLLRVVPHELRALRPRGRAGGEHGRGGPPAAAAAAAGGPPRPCSPPARPRGRSARSSCGTTRRSTCARSSRGRGKR